MGIFGLFFNSLKGQTIKNEKIENLLCEEIIDGIPFGYKNSWFVFKNLDFELIKSKLNTELQYLSTVSFEEGLKQGWGGYFALLKPINNYTILISSNGGNFLETAKKLSKELGTIEYYMTHRGSNIIAISRFEYGLTKREFVVTGDSGVITNEGIPTEIEIKIAEKEKEIILNNARQEDIEYYKKQELLSFLGDEENLMEIAENWSINPSKLDKYKVHNCVEIYDLKK